MRISDWSSDVCSSDLSVLSLNGAAAQATAPDVNADDEDGAAEEFVENPNSRVGGTGSIGVSRGEEGELTDPALVNTSDPHLQNSSAATERGARAEAATALAHALAEPVPEDSPQQFNEDGEK